MYLFAEGKSQKSKSLLRRDKFNIEVGINRDLIDEIQIDLAEEEIIEKIARIVGGATYDRLKGVWVHGAEDNVFTGEIEHCVVISIEISILPSLTPTAMPEIREIIKAASRKYGLGCEHFHCTQQTVESWNFQDELKTIHQWFEIKTSGFPFFKFFRKGH